MRFAALTLVIGVLLPVMGCSSSLGPDLRIFRDGNWLVIRSFDATAQFPEIRVNYLEAYCRPNSTDADWVKHTVIKHTSEVTFEMYDRRAIAIKDTLADGVIVEHMIIAGAGEVDFKVVAHNPTEKESEAHWAQPCVRLGPFCGFNEPAKNSPTDYLPKCFVYVDGKLTRMPFEPWATTARYTPGQVWRPRHVPPTDVNPRPVSTVTPSNGLIGCFSGDEKFVFATAWEPYQELFQGVARCLHSDFRLGGLKPGETKTVRGKIYVLPADEKALLAQYKKDFE